MIFKINPNGTAYTVLFEFNGTTTGGYPQELLLASDGNLYGMCGTGGTNNLGTIYKIKADGTQFVKLMDFSGTLTGSYPSGGLTQLADGDLIGVTPFGGTNGPSSLGDGVLFKIKTDGSGFSKLFDFSLSNGYGPNFGKLKIAPSGDIYGMTYGGGTYANGVMFKVNSTGTGFTKVFDFTTESGSAPYTMQVAFVPTSPQTLSFSPVSDKRVGDAPFQLSATASSSLSPTFTSSAPLVLAISGSTATPLTAGKVTITAYQPGNLSINPVSGSQTICVTPAKPVVTQTGSLNNPVLTSSATSGNQWYKNGVAIANAINISFTATETGVYSVKTTVDNCTSESSADLALVITGDISPQASPGLIIYPNPVRNIVFVKLQGGDRNKQAEMTVYDINGKLLDQMTFGSGEISFSVAHYPTGSYIVKVVHRDKTYVARFIRE